ncbi:MAG: M20 family metallo-hydrolase [Desulfurococcaceae archaeon]
MVALLEHILKKISHMNDYAVNLLSELIKRPSINPAFGGEGEYDKAMFLYETIRSWGFSDIKVINAHDPRAKNSVRPNILAFIEGEVKDKLWILTHLDVVPPGDLSSWTITKPFEPRILNGKVFGRGAEDNGQSMVASLIAAKALLESGIKPRRTVVLAFVSDEEAGSKYGLEYLIENHRDLFGENDVALVPDAGDSNGGFIEVAEKGILWVRLRIKGLQVHASLPHKGLNAHRIAAELITGIDKLIRNKYGSINSLFEPPYTTCEPTMTRNYVESPNIIPGEHEFVLDCRLLPEHSIDSLIKDIGNIYSQIANIYEKKINSETYPKLEIEVLQKQDPAPITPPNSTIVQVLAKSLRELRGIEPRIGGIGGGTVAAFFRRMGIPAVVWSTIEETAHMPNEYCKIKNLIEDAKVIAYLMMYTS